MKAFAHGMIRKIQQANWLFALSAILFLGGCGGPHVPKADLMDFLRKSMPEGLELTDVSFEVAANQNGQSNAVVPLKAKISVRATQDLFSQPTDPNDIKAVNDYVNFYNAYVTWTNALQQTSYADELNQSKPKIDASVPRFLHRDQLKGDTFSGYCDVMAEHQVDRWIFSPVAGIDWGNKKPSSAAAKFGPNCVGANAPDGQAAVQQFQANEGKVDQFEKQFADKHAAESQPMVQALTPFLTSGQEIQTFAVEPDQEVMNQRFTFSEYDPQTQHFRVRFRSTLGDFMGDGQIVGNAILIFYDSDDTHLPVKVSYVGSYDPQKGDLILRRKGSDNEVLHARNK